MRCAGRRRRPCGAADGLAPPAPAAPSITMERPAPYVCRLRRRASRPPIRPAVGVEGIGLQVVERLNGWDLAHPPGGSFDRGHRVPPAGARAGILLLGHPAGWPVGARRVTSVYVFKQSGEA